MAATVLGNDARQKATFREAIRREKRKNISMKIVNSNDIVILKI